MSTAIDSWPFPEKRPGGAPRHRLQVHGSPSMDLPTLVGPRIPRSGVEAAPRLPIATGQPWGPTSASDLQSQPRGTPLVGCLDPTEGDPDEVGHVRQLARSCVPVEPPRGGDCFSQPVAGEPVSCTAANGGAVPAVQAASPGLAAGCTRGAWVHRVPDSVQYPSGHGRVPTVVGILTPPSDRRRRAEPSRARA